MNALLLAAALTIGCPCGCDQTGVCSCDVCGDSVFVWSDYGDCFIEVLPAPREAPRKRIPKAPEDNTILALRDGSECQACCGAGKARRSARREARRSGFSGGSCSGGSCSSSMTFTKTVTVKKFTSRQRERGGCSNCR